MIAVILAAGMSTRLRQLTDRMPKTLLPVGGTPLLGRTLAGLESVGIERCVIVTGYRREMIEEYVGSLDRTINVSFVCNDCYSTTGNNYSLFLAAPFVKNEEMLLLDADILFDASILRKLIEAPQHDALVIKTVRPLGEEEIKVELDEHGDVATIGKHIDPSKARGESIGIEKFSAGTTRILFETLNGRKDRNEFYEASFQEIIDRGVRIAAIDCRALACMEIDTVVDFAEAQELAKELGALPSPAVRIGR